MLKVCVQFQHPAHIIAYASMCDDRIFVACQWPTIVLVFFFYTEVVDEINPETEQEGIVPASAQPGERPLSAAEVYTFKAAYIF